MLIVINPNKTTKQVFFKDLINYLYQHTNVTLRQLKKVFPDVRHLDRHLDLYIEETYILRDERRYYLNLPLLKSTEGLQLDSMVFVDNETPIYQELQELVFETRLANKTNDLIIIERTDFTRDTLTLSNYFYKLGKGYSLSTEQNKLYQIIGDVNPDYALKYLSTFLMKFIRKDLVLQKRPDIFCKTLVELNYLQEKEEHKYQLNGKLDQVSLHYVAPKKLDYHDNSQL
ncbi:DUF1803 domain-containing protein [Streptococcus porcinus]|uniref:Domain of uncharacterized function (DUF1803) n=2 Tax=Streptococcus porcinus TaxID=1340 RepID=A0A4V0HC78_STRPO|nr:DUF1803 domain-containing protein [Streptococcus porcinus]EGJ27343.1 hypothetical protein STRPO_0868 [Streptococcus porcinus str. Jelinkova 176]SQG44906.1 Domain of uncharacterised function (DUF1803) [Streptococcus porcinus]VTT45427.1 Domain of uncharacterised function (DUF1803) [Streptococcus porcinus]VTT46894.1 Domain of uncharacterised function (DUF1803) [Streptococcus porcinus]